MDMYQQLLQQALEAPLEDVERANREFNAKAAQAEREQIARESAIVRAALDNDAGREFLAWLARKTVLRGENDIEAAAQTAEAYALAKAKRSGQNGVFFMMVNAIQQGRDIAAGVTRVEQGEGG